MGFNSKQYSHDYYLKNKEKIKAGQRDYYLKNKEYFANHNKEYNALHTEEAKIRERRNYLKNRRLRIGQAVRWSKENRVRIRARAREIKIEVLAHYGNSNVACVLCGYSDERALSIDHINGGGHQHRKDRDIKNMYRWLKRNNYPDGFRTLCMNCQFIERERLKEEKRNAEPVPN